MISSVTHERADASDRLSDRIIECCIYALLVFSPLAFGVVHAWSEAVMFVLVAIAWLCLLWKMVSQEQMPIIWSWAYLPIAAFILMALVQLVPLPFDWVAFVSPRTAALKQELLGDLPQGDAILSKITLSFYPNATRHDLRIAMTLASVFFIVLNVFTDKARIKRLLTVIAAIGGGITVLAIAQVISSADKIYWSVATGHGLARAGTFVHHSHHGQFVNLSIGAALAIILVTLHEAFTTRKNVTPNDVLEYLASPAARKVWILMCVVIAGVVTVFLSLTRGGMVSLLVAGGVTTLVLGTRGSMRGRGWMMALMCLGAFIIVLYCGFDAVYERLMTLEDWDSAEGGRLDIVKNIGLAWTQFPLFGTGLGTHRVVYPMFDRSTNPLIAGHAENEYAQLVEETGALGLVILLVFGMIVWVCYARAVKTASEPICSAAYGLGFGLVAILVHSLSDFGQHLPANALLSTIFCAIMITLVRPRKPMDTGALCGLRSTRTSRILRKLTFVLSSFAWLWILADANYARIAESYWRPVSQAHRGLTDRQWQGSDVEYSRLAAQATIAARYDPDNVFYSYWSGVYNWYDLSRNVDPARNKIALTDSGLLRSARIVDTMNYSRAICPTFGPAYCVLGELEKYVLGREGGEHHIRVGYRLAPCDPIACFVAGRLDAREGLHQSAQTKLARAIQLDGNLFDEVVAICLDELQDPNFAIRLAEANSGRLAHIAKALSEREFYHSEAKELIERNRRRSLATLKWRCRGDDAPASAYATLGNHYLDEGHTEEAIALFRKALARDYANISLRYRLAQVLEEDGDLAGAMREAKICLRLRANYNPARQLVLKLATLPVKGNTERE